MRPFIGIDFGTMFTVAASSSPPGPAIVITSAAGRRKTPSVVAFTDTVPAVGRDLAAGISGHVVRCAKMMLGDADRRLPVPRSASARPEEVTGLLLARMKADAERALGTGITDAVLTVPGSFDFAARRAIRDAGAIGGLRVRHVLTEATAAVLAYRDRLPSSCSVLVFGLGGGVFGSSLVRLSGDRIEVRASTGDRRLGGWDWDSALMRLVQDRLTAARGPDMLATDGAEALLRLRVRAAKHRLSFALHTDVALRQGQCAWRIPVSRTDFEAATRHLLGRARALAENLLVANRVDPDEIHRVLLVGGPTRMPAVPRMLRRLLGVPIERSLTPDEVVALGAALYDGGLHIREVASHGLGVLARSAGTGALRNVTIVPAGTALPATGSAVFTTGEDGHERVVVAVTVGDGAEPEAVRTVHREVVALATRGPEARIEVRCRYDPDEVPHVELWEAATSRLLGEFPVRSRDAMTEAELRAATRRVGALRFD